MIKLKVGSWEGEQDRNSFSYLLTFPTSHHPLLRQFFLNVMNMTATTLLLVKNQ